MSSALNRLDSAVMEKHNLYVNNMKNLKQKIDAGIASKFEQQVYERCIKAFKFCKKYDIPAGMAAASNSYEFIMMGILESDGVEKYSSFTKDLEAGGHVRKSRDDRHWTVSPIELHFLEDMGSPFVETASRIYRNIKPRIIDKRYTVNGHFVGYVFQAVVVDADILFSKGNEEGKLVFDDSKFVSLDVTGSDKSFSMGKKERPEDFIQKLEDYEKSL